MPDDKTKTEDGTKVVDATTEILTEIKDVVDGVKPVTPVADDAKKTEDPKAAEAKTEIDETKYNDAIKAQESFTAILEEHGYDSAEELQADLDSGKSLKDLIGDRDAKQAFEDADLLATYEAHWAKQEEKKQLDEEEPDETISRLTKANQDLQNAEADRKAKKTAVQEAEGLIKVFNTTVSGEIDSSDLPKEYVPFASKYLGVENPANNVDVTQKAAVKSFAKVGIKDIKAFEQAVIKNYLNGKTEVTKVATSSTTEAPAEKAPKNEKGLEGLRDRMFDSLGISRD